jgi:hypothetical protein
MSQILNTVFSAFYHIEVEILSAMHRIDRNYHALLHDELVKNILRIDTCEFILYLIVRYWNQGTSRSSLAPPGPQNLQAHPFFIKHKQLFSSASMQVLLPSISISVTSLAVLAHL